MTWDWTAARRNGICTLIWLLAATTAYAQKDRSVQVALQYISTFGEKGSGPGEFLEPSGIAVDAVGNLYVADTGNDRLQKFGRGGTYLSEVGGFGWSEGQFNRPVGVADGRGLEIFVADSGNSRIQIFTQHLRMVGTIGGREADGPVPLGTLGGIAVSGEGGIYVSDTDMDQVVHISTYSRTDLGFGGYGYGSGRLRRPLGLAVGEKGEVYVCDQENDRVAVFDRFGNFKGGLGEEILSEPAGVCVGPEGTLIVADAGYHRVVVFDLARGEAVGQVGGPDSGKAPGAFSGPRGVAMDVGGILYILDTGNCRIQRFRVQVFRR